MVREIEKRTVLEGMMIGSVCYRPDLQRALLNLPPEAEESVSTLRMVELIYNHRCQMQMRRGLFSSTHLPQVQACSEGVTWTPVLTRDHRSKEECAHDLSFGKVGG